MKKSSVLLIALTFLIAINLWIGTATSQAPPAAQQAPAAPAGGQRGAPGTENGIAVFKTQCVSCHGNPKVDKAMSPAAIRDFTPERIYESLTTGKMKEQGDKL